MKKIQKNTRFSSYNFFPKNRKGQVFTVIAILLIILTFASVEFFSFLQKNQSIKTRVITMDDFLTSIEENLERQIYISGFRAIFLAENQIIASGSYVNNIDDFFNEAFFNGTIEGAYSDIMLGVNYTDIISSINDKARKVNVDIVLNNSKFNITQDDPWNVNVSLVSHFTMVDRSDLVKWEKMQTISTTIPISFFWDPVSIVERDTKKINQSSYYEDSNSPGFLKRLKGDLTTDANGIKAV